MANFSDTFRKLSLPILLVSTLITAILAFGLINSPPEFNTDLDAFTPESSQNDAHERIHEYFPDETRPLFINVESDDGSNILDYQKIIVMYEHVSKLKNLSQVQGNSVVSWTTTPTIIQTALDEEANGTKLSSVNSWNNLVDLVVDDDTECRLTDDDQFLSTATYASSALLNKDFDFSPTCDYLSDGQGDSTPITSSTLWVLEIDPEMSEPESCLLYTSDAADE